MNFNCFLSHFNWVNTQIRSLIRVLVNPIDTLIIINLTKCIGYACRADKNPYRHDLRANKNPYQHDRRADKNPYRHDRRVDSQCRIIKD